MTSMPESVGVFENGDASGEDARVANGARKEDPVIATVPGHVWIYTPEGRRVCDFVAAPEQSDRMGGDPVNRLPADDPAVPESPAGAEASAAAESEVVAVSEMHAADAASPDKSDPGAAEQAPEPPRMPDQKVEIRARLTAKFEAWLDQMLADEPPPRGIPEHLIADALAEEPSSNLYDLFSALTGLTGEIKLQGRAFKQLTELLSPLAETPALLARLEESAAESSAAILEALEKPAVDDGGPPVAFEQICQVMIDMHDRLVRGMETCDQGIASLNTRRERGPLQRWLGISAVTNRAVQAVDANREAAAMTLARLVAALADWGVQLIGRVGEHLDPERMSAVDTRENDDLPAGTVLVVNRSGYAINGNIKAVARVTVSQNQI